MTERGISDRLFSFVTAPSFGENLHFAVFEDTRDPVNGLSAVVKGILALPDRPDFAVHVATLSVWAAVGGYGTNILPKPVNYMLQCPLFP